MLLPSQLVYVFSVQSFMFHRASSFTDEADEADEEDDDEEDKGGPSLAAVRLCFFFLGCPPAGAGWSSAAGGGLAPRHPIIINPAAERYLIVIEVSG